MASDPALRVRRSILDIQRDYENGNKAELENLMRAWQGIKRLDPTDLNSFFIIGGYHGEPFRGPGATDPQWWGGYCQHGTVLFPSWHRAYLYRLEEALRSIPGCGDVTLPFWDECSADTQNEGIPTCLTDERFFLDGAWIPNPLRSYTFQLGVVDEVTGDDPVYTKPAGYTTVRYPLSGLVGTPADVAATAAHNAKFPSTEQNTLLLNANVAGWLTTPVSIPQPDGSTYRNGLLLYKFAQCLDAPNYTLFSNTTSAGAWNADPAHKQQQVVPLETPHNAMHLAVGGFDSPTRSRSLIPGANGDMGENETAALDPIFFFHHCFIDYTFWIWQRRQGATDMFDIDASDPGASYSLQNGPSPPAGADPSEPMSLETPLRPFPSTDGERIMITRETINIERDLGYTYGPGSLDVYAQAPAKAAFTANAVEDATRIVHVSKLNRAKIKGSFVIAAYAEIDGVQQLIDANPVLSRWSVEGCANCQLHLEATADFRVSADIAQSVEVRVHTRGGMLGGDESPQDSAGFVKGVAMASGPSFTVEIR
jgi:tyrosinase